MEVRKFFSEMKQHEFQKVPSSHTSLSGSC